MMPTRNLTRMALCLILFLTSFTITITNAATEGNYKNDNNFLTDIYESTHSENGYITDIIINTHAAGFYTAENGYRIGFAITTEGIGGTLEENNYRLDLIPQKTFSDIQDVAVNRTVTSKTIVGQGFSMRINLTVSNQALNYETFYVTVKANTTSISSYAFTLANSASRTVTFAWNTAGFAKGYYTISAYAWPVVDEIDISDNNRIDGTVLVTIPGDVTGDKKVDGKDITLIAVNFGKTSGFPPNADITNDGKIDGKDITVAAINFGKTWT